jgi:hypothetical protein
MRTENDTTIQKRHLVAEKRLSANFDKGGLQIPHPEEMAQGLHLNLIQKYLREMNNDQHTKYTCIIEQVLRRAGSPDLNEHINKMKAVKKTGIMPPYGGIPAPTNYFHSTLQTLPLYKSYR